MEAALVLQDGSVWQGKGFGAEATATGEVVFTTGMVGYTESVTDPSYRGQMLCQTYPLIGNYGVSKNDFESDRPQIAGYIVSEACRKPSHYSAEMTLDEWLVQNSIPGIEGLDTRELTKRLRTKGVMLGLLAVSKGEIDIESLASQAKDIPDPNKRDLASEVSVKKEVVYENASSKGTVVAVDTGIKMNIIRCLLDRGMRVIRVPASTKADRILAHDPDAVLFSNGPGDPANIPYVTEACRAVLEAGKPVMGICLGNQVLAMALGGRTYKLKFGHRGQNHPVISVKTGACSMTSQNHGYAVDYDSLDRKEVEVTHVHANDNSVEGLESRKYKAVGYQWHPEHSPGPMDTEALFDRLARWCNG